MTTPRPHIVLIEDNETDVLLVKRALTQHGIDCELEHWADGELAETAIRGGESNPSLVLVDLNLPRVGGFDLLRLIRSRPQLAGVRVVVFTSSNSPADMRRARELGADAYIVKPPELNSFLDEVGRRIREFLRGDGNVPAEAARWQRTRRKTRGRTWARAISLSQPPQRK
jgi:DNA-binding response OmpR family regulator